LLSSRIGELFFATVELTGVRTLHTFIRIARFNEIDTSNIYFRVWRDHPEIETFAPRTDPATGLLESVQFSAATEWDENEWGIREPKSEAMAEPAEMDVVLVPLLSFDLDGHRVGYGKGYYDRFLDRCRPDCLKVGLSYFPPVEAIDDIHAGDVALDLCVTPDRVYRPRSLTEPIDLTDAVPS
jgi:5-formyltetrahydrofolate cyclo-ligase